ncbi:MAG: hypothetical protein IJE89_00330 [Bacilli bacterium]|nr:hypothetical protein [Bacilli bacterium]MBQ9854527.1 hypothetical protein [Bacilli bacterium]
MKKLSICLMLILCLFLTGCGEPKELEVASLDTFKTVASNNSFTVSDNMDSYNEVSYITGSMVATYGDIEIEMVSYTDVESAKKVQENQISQFNLLKSTGVFENKTEGDNYYKYILISNNRYMISTRVDNTLVFCKTLITNQEIVEKIYNELGY